MVSTDALWQSIKDAILSPLSDQKLDDLEYEIRFGTFDETGRFKSNVDSSTFYRLIKSFEEDNRLQVVCPKKDQCKNPLNSESVFYFDDGKEQRADHVLSADTATIINKKPIATVDSRKYSIRVAKTRELAMGTIEWAKIPPESAWSAYRKKERWSFAVDQDISLHFLKPFQIDLSHVTGWSLATSRRSQRAESRQQTTTFEVELEFKDIIDNPAVIQGAVKFMSQLIQDSRFPISSDTTESIRLDFNGMFPDARGNRFGLHNPISKPINLPKRALDSPSELSITFKADGERRLLLIRTSGAYLIYPPKTISKYLRISDKEEQISDEDRPFLISKEIATELSGTLFDGELVRTKKNPDKNYFEYLAFDILFDRGTDVRDKNLGSRLMIASKVWEKLKSAPIKLKSFLFPSNGGFYDRTNAILDSMQTPSFEYQTDGLIFNDPNSPYSGVVYKWKPENQLTIDFKLTQDTGGFVLTVKDKFTYREEQFKPKEAPLAGFLSPQNIPARFSLYSGQIVEMNWDATKGSFIPVRIRYDRAEPNYAQTAYSIWNDIVRPITERTIRGTDLMVMRRYHNVLKTELLKECNGPLADIGSGQGGDIHKWMELGKQVVAIEPNERHIAEFRKRLATFEYRQQGENKYRHNNGSTITILQAKGQETVKIARTVGNVPCVAMFDSLTFFFETEETLDAIIATINSILEDNGIFMGIMMDGDKVRETLKTTDKIDMPNWSIEKMGRDEGVFGNIIKINLKEESIVSEQIEYLTNFNVLEEKLKSVGIVLLKTGFSINTQIPESQAILNNFYRRFVFKRMGAVPPIVIPPAPSLKPLSPFSETIKVRKMAQREPQKQPEFAPPTVVPVVFKGKGKYGDFSWMIEKNPHSLFLFIDTDADAETAIAGEGTASVRPFNKFGSHRDYPRSAGISNVYGYVNSIAEIKDLIKTHEYKYLFWPATSLSGEDLYTDNLTISPDDRKYIVVEIKSLGPEVKIAASAKQTITVSPSTTATFLAVAPMVSLKPEATVDFVYKGTAFTRIGVADGCLLNALLRASSKKYEMGQNAPGHPPLTAIQIASRKTHYSNVKEALISTIFGDVWKYSLSSVLNKKNYKTFESAKFSLSLCSQWPFLDLWNTLSMTFHANITIIIVETPFSEGHVFKTRETFEKTIILYNYAGRFDVIATKDTMGRLVTTQKPIL